MDIGHQLRAMELGMRVVASFPEWKKTPIILGESDPEGCAACKGAQNGYRNGPLYGVSVAEATALAGELAKRNGVNLQGAVTWAFEFENQPIFAGFRELATGGMSNGVDYLVDKPVLNVFRMMGMMGGDYVSVTSTGALPGGRGGEGQRSCCCGCECGGDSIAASRGYIVVELSR